MVGQAQNTNKALRRRLFANKGLPAKDRLTVWMALTFSKPMFHAATWGTLTADIRKIIEATYQQGLRISH